MSDSIETVGWTGRLWLVSVLLLTPPVIGAACGQGPARCVDEIELTNDLALLRDEKLENRAVYGIYAGPCDGVLYLIDLARRERNAVNESWHFYQFESASFVADRRDQIEVVASYATGIGPGGADLFRARIVMQHRAGGTWVAQEAEVLGSWPTEADEPANVETPDETTAMPVDASLRDVRSAEALEALEVESNGERVPLFADLETSRIVIKSIWLTSGSSRIGDVQVRQTEDEYLVFYDVESPRLGTADMKRSLMYLVLPKDGLSVSFHEFGDSPMKGRHTDLEAVVIDRGTFIGAPPP